MYKWMWMYKMKQEENSLTNFSFFISDRKIFRLTEKLPYIIQFHFTVNSCKPKYFNRGNSKELFSGYNLFLARYLIIKATYVTYKHYEFIPEKWLLYLKWKNATGVKGKLKYLTEKWRMASVWSKLKCLITILFAIYNILETVQRAEIIQK